MTVWLSKRLSKDTVQYGLTIQVGLSGFSFKIRDRKDNLFHHETVHFPHRLYDPIDVELPFKKAISTHPLLKLPYGSVRIYFDTEKHTLLPRDYETSELEQLRKLYELHEYDEVHRIPVAGAEADLVYALPSGITSVNNHLNSSHFEFYPVIARLLEHAATLTDYNRVLCAYDGGFAHVVASEGGALRLAASYPVADFQTACYYVFAVMREVMFNPGLTTLRYFGPLSENRESLLKRYFSGVELCGL